MEYRNKLNRKKKKALLIVLGFWLPCVLLTPIMVFSGYASLAYLFAIFTYLGGAIFYLHYYFCLVCPSCKNSLGLLILAPNKQLFKISPKIKFCPYCGTAFDA